VIERPRIDSSEATVHERSAHGVESVDGRQGAGRGEAPTGKGGPAGVHLPAKPDLGATGGPRIVPRPCRGRDEGARPHVEGRDLTQQVGAVVEPTACGRPEGPRRRRDDQRLLKASPDARSADSFAAMHALAVALLPHLCQLLAAQRRDEGLVDVCAVVPGPRRTIMAACRRGEVSGAVRVGRRWLASRGCVDAWLRSRNPGAIPPSGDEDELESVRRSLATPGRQRRGR